MFKIESNLEEFKETTLKTFEQLINVDKVLREAANDALVLVSDRVQQRGLKTDGSPIKADHKKPNRNLNTPYSEAYAKKRQKAGREINIVDLTFTNGGGMMDDFLVAPEGSTGYAIGFRGQTASDKADWNERRFGAIFQLSDPEINLVQGIVSKKINAIISQAG